MEITGGDFWEGEVTAKQTDVEEGKKSTNGSGEEEALISTMEVIGEEIWRGEDTAKEITALEHEKSKNGPNEEQVG